LFSPVASGDPENKRKYIHSAEQMTADIKMPTARTNPVKQAVIIAVVMVKVKRG